MRAAPYIVDCHTLPRGNVQASADSSGTPLSELDASSIMIITYCPLQASMMKYKNAPEGLIPSSHSFHSPRALIHLLSRPIQSFRFQHQEFHTLHSAILLLLLLVFQGVSLVPTLVSTTPHQVLQQ